MAFKNARSLGGGVLGTIAFGMAAPSQQFSKNPTTLGMECAAMGLRPTLTQAPQLGRANFPEPLLGRMANIGLYMIKRLSIGLSTSSPPQPLRSMWFGFASKRDPQEQQLRPKGRPKTRNGAQPQAPLHTTRIHCLCARHEANRRRRTASGNCVATKYPTTHKSQLRLGFTNNAKRRPPPPHNSENITHQANHNLSVVTPLDLPKRRSSKVSNNTGLFSFHAGSGMSTAFALLPVFLFLCACASASARFSLTYLERLSR